MIASVQTGILQDVEARCRDDHEVTDSSNQMPPQNISIPQQGQQHQQQQQQHAEHQMSQILVDQHTGIGVSMADQHSSHALEHAHAMAEHAAHSMLDLSETGSLEHLAGGGHTPQSLADLTASGRGPGQSLDAVAANGGRRHQHPDDRMSSLADGSASMRQMSGDRDMSVLSGGGGGSNPSSNGLVSRPLSVLGGGSLADRQSQPMRNLTPVGLDGRGGQHGNGLGTTMSSDGRGSVGLGNQNMSAGGGAGNVMQESRISVSQALGYSSEQPPNMLNSVPIIPRRGRPPTLNAAQQHLGAVDQQQRGGQSLPPHMRGLSDHQGHPHQGLVEHHSQQQGLGGDNTNNHNGRNGMSAFGLDSNTGQLHSRPGSTLLSEASSHSDARDLTRPVYSTPSLSGDRGGQQVTSLIEETIAAVASNFNKSSPDGGIMPGPLPPNSLMGLSVLGLARSSSAMSHLGHGGDDSLADLVGRHHTHSIPLLSERASHSLSGLMDDHSINHSQGHVQGRELEKTHPCLTCLKMFRSKQQLAQHSLVHTGIRKHICSFCDRAFKQLSHLQQHVRIHTGAVSCVPPNRERKYVCQICNRAFKQLTHLQKHHVIHTGERKYICQCCDRAFKQLTHLQQHYRIHTDERKYVCQCCDRAFRQQSHLNQHFRIHTGEKPYRCKFENCERAFAQLSNLQHHMRNHDDQVKKEATRIHKCQICHRCYTNESSLKSHTLKMHIHIKPIDQHTVALPKKRRKRKNKDLYGGAPTMVPVSSSADGSFPGLLPSMKTSSSRPRSPSSSDDDDDEIIFVGEQMGPPRVDNFGSAVGALGSQVQMLQSSGGRSHDLSHQIPFSGMGNFSRGADPLALLASANRFSLQDNMMSGLAGSLNSFSDQLTFRDAALLNSRFGDLRGPPSQGAGFDDRFSTGNFNQQQQQQLQRDRDFGNSSDMSSRSNSGNNSVGGSGSGSSDNMQTHNNNSGEVRNQIPAHNQGMIRSSGMGGLSAGMGGMMSSQGGLGGLMKQIKQEPLDYFTSSCHGGDQFAGMGVGSGGSFLSPQHIINSHLRGQLPSLNVPLIRDHFSHNQMLPHSSASSGSSSTPVPIVASSSTPATSLASTTSSLASLPLPLTHMGIYHQSHFTNPQRISGLHPSPASTPSSQLSVGANLSSNLSSQGGRSPLEQEDLRCFSPLRN
ncbi:hypothetical protein BsWGS_25910 [Bradybaena similaris]